MGLRVQEKAVWSEKKVCAFRVHVCIELIAERQGSALFDQEHVNMHVPSHEHSNNTSVLPESM